MLASASHQPDTPGTDYSQLIRSTDGALSWTAVYGDQGEYGNGQFDPVISPVSPKRAYRHDSTDYYAMQLQASSDGGQRLGYILGRCGLAGVELDPLRSAMRRTGYPPYLAGGSARTPAARDPEWNILVNVPDHAFAEGS